MRTITITTKCAFCQQEKAIKVPEKGFKEWQNGALIQNAMPNVSIDDRELLISGVCGSCF